MNRLLISAAIALACTTVACKPEDPQAAAAAAAAQKAQQEHAADELAKQFEDAYAQQNWSLARGFGDQLMMEHPQSAAAGRIKERLDDAKAKLEAGNAQRRMAALWAYQTEPVKGGNQLSAAIYSKDPVDTDGHGRDPVRLIFRDHPGWGRSSYLVLQAGDFDCYGGCRVKVSVDGGAAKPMVASRPKTDEAIAMFIEDERALWRMARESKRIVIEVPLKGAGKRNVEFEVGGLDAERLPKW